MIPENFDAHESEQWQLIAVHVLQINQSSLYNCNILIGKHISFKKYPAIVLASFNCYLLSD